MRLSYGWSEGGAGRDRNKSARLAALRLGAEPDLLREHAALLRIAGRDHRIVGGQVPLLTILFGGHLIVRHQMPLEHLELFPVLETDDIVRLYRRTDRNGWFLLNRRLFGGLPERGERPVDVLDDQRQVGNSEPVVYARKTTGRGEE